MAITRITSPAITGLTIPNTSINNASLNSVTALPSGVGGKVLQIKTLGLDPLATTSTSFTSAGSVNITPINATSTMIITFQYSTGYTSNSGHNYTVTIFRDSTNLGTGGFSGTNFFSGHGGELFGGFSATLSDAGHDTTNQIAYKVMVKSNNGSTFHVGKDDAHQTAKNEMVILEVL